MTQPLVSVFTPVYNGEDFLAECIESVLAQTYSNWEYHVVDNRSTDRSRAIAEAYAAKDPRIKVTINQEFVGVVENYNRCFRLVSPESRFAKALAADDYLMPQCLSEMVGFGLAHPSVGIIGSYQRRGDTIRWQSLPPSVTFLTGREACRLALIKRVHLFGGPTAFLYRSDLLRRTAAFFPHTRPHADTSACYEALQHSDYGIVHEELSVERVHPGQVSSRVEELGGGALAYLEVLFEYGPRFLDKEEFEVRKREEIDYYYRHLGNHALKLRGWDFWAFQSSRLKEIGLNLEWNLVAASAARKFVSESRNPRAAVRKFVTAVEAKFHRH